MYVLSNPIKKVLLKCVRAGSLLDRYGFKIMINESEKSKRVFFLIK